MTARLREAYKCEIAEKIKKELKFSNVMQVPRFEKVVLSMGVGRIFQDSVKLEHAKDAITYISGQRAQFVQAKKSVAAFKVREGMKTGIKVTLRRDYMYEFLDRLRNIYLPRMRDFRGLDERSFNGNSFSFGIRDYNIFPEVREILKKNENLGLNVTFVVNQNNAQSFKMLLECFGFPFREIK
jgi:large subunit ribosomal protein L5